MSNRSRQLHFGLMFWAGGTHPAGWRWPTSHAAAAFDIEFLQKVTQAAERAKFDFLFLGDRLASDPALQTTNPSQMSRLEPFVSAASLAAATSHIGIVVTANPTYYDPYTVARLFASLDHLSKGRASWNLVTGADAIAAANFSRDSHWDTEKRYEWAGEFVAAVKSLWDSWERGATHAHKGRYFDIQGPLTVKRPPQGHPVILHAGTSEQSRELAARDADVVFAGQGTVEAAKAYYADVKQRARKYGRDGDDIKILPGLTPIVAPTTEEAVAIYDTLNRFIPLDPEAEPEKESRFGALGRFGRRRNLASLSQIIGVDVRGSQPDDPVDPSVFEAANEEGRKLFAAVEAVTRRGLASPERVTYRDLIVGFSNLGAVVVGNPAEVADFIQLWFEERAADGFNIFPTHVPDAVTAFTELVIPVLQQRGLFRKEYSGTTFRDHVGLPVPGTGAPEIRVPPAVEAARLRSTVLVTPQELKAAIASGKAPVILDVGGARPGTPAVRVEGLPGAVPVDLGRELAGEGGGDKGTRPLPDIAELEENARRWGIDRDSPVVLYDDKNNLQAARGWWILRWAGLANVRLLDGGLTAWTDAGFDLEPLSSQPPSGDVDLSEGHLPVLDTAAAARRAREGVLLDARDAEVYEAGGHIPGALNVPARGNLAEDGRFADPEILKARYGFAGVDGNGPVGVSCGSGVSAAHNIAALATLGIDAELYVGSWSAWSADPGRPRAVGAAPG